MSRIRLVPIIFIVVISFALMYGAVVGWRQFQVINPLESRLKVVPGVSTVDIQLGSPSMVNVQLDPAKVTDLQTTYQELTKDSRDTLGDAKVNVSVADSSLQSTFEAMYPSLDEGLARATYNEMISTVESIAAKQGVKAHITMDTTNIYIQLSKGNHYYFDIVPIPHQGGVSS